MADKIARIDRGAVDSVTTFAVIITGNVPVGMVQEDIAAWLTSALTANLMLGPQMKSVVVQVSQENPEALAKRLAGAISSLAH